MKIAIKIGFFVLTIVFVFSCNVNDSIQKPIVYQSSAEFVEGDFLTDSLHQYTFESANMRTNEFARTGKYCVKLDSTHLYGFSIKIPNIKKGEFIYASAWQKEGTQDGTLICTSENDLYKRTHVHRMPAKDGWRHHSITLYANENYETITIFVFAGGKKAYFDDFKIVRTTKINEHDYDTHLEIYIPDSSQKKLNNYVENAINSKIITQANKKYVNAFILTKTDSIPIQMRLKGDWTDHLTSGKISYRIKIKGNYSFMGLKTFSIQHPDTRNNMHEWFVHHAMDKEDLLSTKYDFLTVKINGVNKGLYAIEEHFDKQLLESRKRREGPIVKIDESGFWEVNLLSDSIKNLGVKLPFYQSSFISLFKKKRTLKNKVLKQQFIEASKLLTLYKNKYNNPEQIFDLEKLAKSFVIYEISHSHHGFAWHNLRFYFNPITQKLEPIGYDLLPGTTNYSDLGIMEDIKGINKANEHSIKRSLILDKKFKEYYLFYLKKFANKNYLDTLFSDLKLEIEKRENLFKSEQPEFFFSKEFYYRSIDFINKNIKDLEKTWDSILVLNKSDLVVEDAKYTNANSSIYLENVSVNFYKQKIDSTQYKIEMENFHLDTLTVVGYYTKKQQDLVIYFDTPIVLYGFNHSNPADYKTVVIHEKPTKLVFKIANNPDTLYAKKLIKWKKPVGISTRMALEQKFNTKSTYYQIKDSVLTFKKGKYQINQLIYIPKQYKVVIPAHTTIDFINGGGLIINNSFYCEGTKTAPIRFTSSDKNNNGITVLKAKKVKMSYVTSDSLNTLHYKKWHLTGGITIYESEVTITNCSISHNLCEDALNIIRSDFSIDSLTITHTYSDGFDADFCSGVITNSVFKYTGNDCIDFSGSEVEIKNIHIVQSGDKGISGGERSTLSIYNIFIDGAITGIAAKDDTKITGESVEVKNAEYGLAAFQKKAEYGKAFIELDKVIYSNLNQKGLVDKSSVVKINDLFFVGTIILDIDKLYARFEK